MLRILVLGSGDVGSAVAHALFRAGHRVALLDDARPAHFRRKMAFCDVYFDGIAELEGVIAKRVRDLPDLDRMLACGRAIPASDQALATTLDVVRPDALVDARVHKHDAAPSLRGLAPVTIGLGPGFDAGRDVDLVVETAWGEELGRVIEAGRARDPEGEPRPIAGHARDRYVYAPQAGRFGTRLEIGARVTAGEAVAQVGPFTITAPLSGTLRGLTHDGADVRAGTKVLEVDPRGEASAFRGLGERPARIAAGVLRALATSRPGS